jgi:hypothetical protein
VALPALALQHLIQHQSPSHCPIHHHHHFCKVMRTSTRLGQSHT